MLDSIYFGGELNMRVSQNIRINVFLFVHLTPNVNSILSQAVISLSGISCQLLLTTDET